VFQGQSKKHSTSSSVLYQEQSEADGESVPDGQKDVAVGQ
jgi:hypothetical protein